MKKNATLLILAFFLCSFGLEAAGTDSINSSCTINPLSILQKGHGRRGSGGLLDKHIITIGVDLNGASANTGLSYTNSKFWKDTLHFASISAVTQTPMYNLMMDFGIQDKMTMGFAFGYQTMSVVWQEGGAFGATFTDSWMRIGGALRFDYHFVATEEMLFYAGLRAGYSYNSMTSTFTQYDKNYTKSMDGAPSKIIGQVHAGFSYFFGVVGINLEAGYSYGETFMAGGGLSFKF
jgi:hypothetical protein